MFGVSSAKAQEVSSYSYIVVPKKFSDFNENQYRLNELAKLQLEKKNYIILPADKEKWPTELQINNCKALTLDVNKSGNLLTNKVSISFTDCSGKVLVKKEGTSRYKEFDKGYQDAVRNAMSGLSPSAPKEQAKSKEPTQISQMSISPTQVEKRDIYVAGGTRYFLEPLTDNSFAFVSEKNNIYANFFNSAEKNIYHVKIYNDTGLDYYTIGFKKDDGYEIEILTGVNQWDSIKLSKLTTE